MNARGESPGFQSRAVSAFSGGGGSSGPACALQCGSEFTPRKGAVEAKNGQRAVIPGAMGSYSYVVMRLGNEESFCSSSHGAGRRYSRKGAMAAFRCEEVILDLERQGVVLGKRGKADVAEESRFAYKDIEEVMENQKDLVIPLKRLKTIGVVKG